MSVLQVSWWISLEGFDVNDEELPSTRIGGLLSHQEWKFYIITLIQMLVSCVHIKFLLFIWVEGLVPSFLCVILCPQEEWLSLTEIDYSQEQI